MQNFDFDKIRYKCPKTYIADRHIEYLIGLDTETKSTGQTFLICTSKGDSFTLSDVPKILFNRQYRNQHFCVYNLRFDAGSLIQALPEKYIDKLRRNNIVKYDGFIWKYIPHKMLRISRGKNAITIWDIFGFYGKSLNEASKQYLGKQKLDIETKTFTDDYIKSHIVQITDYCIQDARLVAELGNYLLKRLQDFGVKPNALFSTASISYLYFKTFAKIINVWSYWIWHRDLLKAACESYSGGKFEIIARGKFTGYEYDISSAYPYEISNLIDISEATVKRSRKYDSDCTYAFLRCTIDNTNSIHHPVALQDKSLNYYPAGIFNATITKEEYLFFLRYKIPVTINDGYYLYCPKKSYPYKSLIKKLYRKKQLYKKKDKMYSNICKIMMNSFYGKMAQLIETDEDDNIFNANCEDDFDDIKQSKKPKILRAGAAWNPIYASIITANVRIRMSELQNIYGKHCIAVHTDSVILDKPIDKKYLGEGLGEFEAKEHGECIMIMCGLYQIGSKSADRGFKVPENYEWKRIFKYLKIPYNKSYNKKPFSWKLILQLMKNKEKILLQEVRPLSWRSAIIQHRCKEINKFITYDKILSLNMDRKRLWSEQTNAYKLLHGLEYSIPRIEGMEKIK